jgi:hypothetical protein
MSSFLMYVSSLFVAAARIPYLDGYVFGTVCVLATVAVNAVVIHCIYEFGSSAK